MSGALPYMKFFPSDWRGATGLKLVSMAARGLWIEMICLMHEAEPYGHLMHAGKALNAKGLAALVGAPEADVQGWLDELLEMDVVKRKRNDVYYSKRMENDEIKRRRASEHGKKGGRPSASVEKEKEMTLKGDEKGGGGVETKPQSPETRVQSPERTPPPPADAEGDEFVFAGMAPAKPKRAPRVSTSRIPTALAEQAVSLWNELAKRNDLVSVRWPINDTRLTKLKKRLEDGGLPRWKEALDKVERSRFLCGEGAPRKIGDAPWQVGFDFLLQPSSWDKIHEGTYRQDRTPPQVAADPANWPEERWDRVHTRYRTSGVWPDGAGPKPEEPGYLGPKYHP